MVMKPPGYVPPPETKRIYKRNAVVGQFLKALHDAKEAKKTKKGLRVERLDHYRTEDGRLHHKDTGRYVKDPVPQHRRIKPVVPWNKGKKMKKKEKP